MLVYLRVMSWTGDENDDGNDDNDDDDDHEPLGISQSWDIGHGHNIDGGIFMGYHTGMVI